MPFDIVLPSVVCIIGLAVVWLYGRYASRIKSLFEEKELRMREVVLLVVTMGMMVTIMVFIPQQAIQILFLAAYSFVLFLFTFIATEKLYFAVLPPVLFLALYLSGLWNIFFLDVFAIIFAVAISVYLGGLFSWTTVLAFAALISVMDVVQVFGTGFMGQAAAKFLDLRLPVFIQLPIFPFRFQEGGGYFLLGLGDLFLAGLLAIQVVQKYGRRAGIIAAASIGFAFFVFEVAVFHLEYAAAFPATLVVVGGWLLGLGIHRIFRHRENLPSEQRDGQQ
jgi:presenilin-like A22 family membrane protease